jgi:hypothetical protein
VVDGGDLETEQETADAGAALNHHPPHWTTCRFGPQRTLAALPDQDAESACSAGGNHHAAIAAELGRRARRCRFHPPTTTEKNTRARVAHRRSPPVARRCRILLTARRRVHTIEEHEEK